MRSQVAKVNERGNLNRKIGSCSMRSIEYETQEKIANQTM